MTPSDAAFDLICYFESFEPEAYPDPASPLGKACTANHFRLRDYRRIINWTKLSGSPWTVGYGHTGSEVKPGVTRTQAQALTTLRTDAADAVRSVNRAVSVTLLQCEFDALVSAVFNIGPAIVGGGSTLLRLLNAGDHAGAANQFPRWNKAGGVEMAGLTRRRAAERLMFLGHNWRDAL